MSWTAIWRVWRRAEVREPTAAMTTTTTTTMVFPAKQVRDSCLFSSETVPHFKRCTRHVHDILTFRPPSLSDPIATATAPPPSPYPAVELQVDEKLAAQQREAQEAAERLRQEQAERLSAAKVSESEAEAALAALSPEAAAAAAAVPAPAQSEVFSHFLGADSAAEAAPGGQEKGARVRRRRRRRAHAHGRVHGGRGAHEGRAGGA